jgi:broad specificity phosphatase PhoE
VSAAPTRLLLVRHAETVQNAGGVVQGRADNPLSALGERQAAALGSSLAGVAIAAVYSSPLGRAARTAGAVAAPHGLPLRTDPDLLEMDIGAMEGLSSAELRQRYPDFLAAWVSDVAGSTPMPAGESLEQVQTRGCAALARIVAAHAGETVAVVSHNFLLLTVLCYVIKLPLASFRRLRLHVASVSMVEARDGGFRIDRLNDICHLERAGLVAADPWSQRR